MHGAEREDKADVQTLMYMYSAGHAVLAWCSVLTAPHLHVHVYTCTCTYMYTYVLYVLYVHVHYCYVNRPFPAKPKLLPVGSKVGVI